MEKDDVYRRLLTAASPMPFGSDPFRDVTVVVLASIATMESPMPFGSDPFRDKRKRRNRILLCRSPMPFGSDPFRDQLSDEMGIFEDAERHQCLSAVIPFGT